MSLFGARSKPSSFEPERPAVSGSKLLRSLSRRVVEDEHGAKTTVFRAGEYQPQFEQLLRDLDVDLIEIQGRPAVLHSLQLGAGFVIKPVKVNWRMPTASTAEYLDGLSAGSRRRFRQKLRLRAGVQEEFKRLTPAALSEWYAVYERSVVGKPHGRRTLPPDKLLRHPQRREFFGAFGRQLETGELLGGAIIRKNRSLSRLTISYAAYGEKAKQLGLPVRNFLTALECAGREGFHTLSHGRDRNLYGHFYTLGLWEHKVRLGFIPTADNDFHALKLLRPERLGGDFVCLAHRPDSSYEVCHLTQRPHGFSCPPELELRTVLLDASGR